MTQLWHHLIIFMVGLLPGDAFPALPLQRTRMYFDSVTVNSTTLYLPPIQNQFVCADEKRDVLMIVYTDCPEVQTTRYLLRQCQSQTVSQCRANFISWYKISLDDTWECILNLDYEYRVAYYCVPPENQFDICSQKFGVTVSQPAALLYSDNYRTPSEGPCYCSVADIPQTRLVVYYFEQRLNPTFEQLTVNNRSVSSHEQFHPTVAISTREYDGFTAWLSGEEPPSGFIAGLFSDSPQSISCGRQYFGSPPEITLHGAFNATITCNIQVPRSNWQLTKFGVVITTISLPTNSSISHFQNSAYCQRDAVQTGFVANLTRNIARSEESPYSNDYQVGNTLALDTFCRESSFKGNLTFRITITIDKAASFDPATKWHCFQENLGAIQASDYSTALAPLKAGPVVETLQYSQAALTCQFPKRSQGQIDKYGLTFTTRTSPPDGSIIDVNNGFYCLRTDSSGTFVVIEDGASQPEPNSASVDTTYHVANRVQTEDRCRTSAFTGEDEFQLTIFITSAEGAHPETRWHCFYEVYGWVQVSSHVEIPFPALSDPSGFTESTTSSTVTSENFDDSTTPAPTVAAIEGDEEQTPLWVFIVAVPVGIIVPIAVIFAVYRLVRGSGERHHTEEVGTMTVTPPENANGDTATVYGAPSIDHDHHTSKKSKGNRVYEKLNLATMVSVLAPSVSTPAAASPAVGDSSSLYSEGYRPRGKKSAKNRKRHHTERNTLVLLPALTISRCVMLTGAEPAPFPYCANMYIRNSVVLRMVWWFGGSA